MRGVQLAGQAGRTSERSRESWSGKRKSSLRLALVGTRRSVIFLLALEGTTMTRFFLSYVDVRARSSTARHFLRSLLSAIRIHLRSYNSLHGQRDGFRSHVRARRFSVGGDVTLRVVSDPERARAATLANPMEERVPCER